MFCFSATALARKPVFRFTLSLFVILLYHRFGVLSSTFFIFFFFFEIERLLCSAFQFTVLSPFGYLRLALATALVSLSDYSIAHPGRFVKCFFEKNKNFF